MSKLQIFEKLGQGGMGVVYRARQETLDREVAVKFLLQATAGDDSRGRFRREVEAMVKLSHPNIVKVYEHGEGEKGPFFLMEYVQGVTVREMIHTHGPLAIERILPIVRQLTAALAECHAQGYIHRDIKPGNVMVTPDGRVVLMDFGLVRPPDGTVMTQDGQLIGTPLFLAPELLLGQPVTAAADVYAMGALLYEAITGHPIHDGTSITDMVQKIVSEDPVPVETHRPEVPRFLAAFVTRCLDRNATRRFRDGGAALKALDRASAVPDPPRHLVLTPRPATPAQAGLRARFVLRWMPAALALAAAAGLLAVVRREGPAGSAGALPDAIVTGGAGRVTVAWTGPEPQVGVVQVLPPAGTAPVAQAADPEATTQHRLELGDLEPAATYRVVAFDGAGRRLPEHRVTAGSIAAAASELSSALDAFDAPSILKRMDSDLNVPTPQHRRHPGRSSDEDLAAWTRLVASRAAASGLPPAIARMARVREKAVLTGAIDLAAQSILLRQLRQMQDLAQFGLAIGFTLKLDLEAAFPAAMRRFARATTAQEPGLFYLFDGKSLGEALAFDPDWKPLPTEVHEKLNFVWNPLRDFVPDESARRPTTDDPMPTPSSEHVPATPLELPGPEEVASLELVMAARGLAQGESIEVIRSTDRIHFEEIARFHTPDPDRYILATPIDRRLAGPGKIWCGLRLHNLPRCPQDRSCTVYFLGVRWQRPAH